MPVCIFHENMFVWGKFKLIYSFPAVLENVLNNFQVHKTVVSLKWFSSHSIYVTSIIMIITYTHSAYYQVRSLQIRCPGRTPLVLTAFPRSYWFIIIHLMLH